MVSIVKARKKAKEKKDADAAAAAVASSPHETAPQQQAGATPDQVAAAQVIGAPNEPATLDEAAPAVHQPLAASPHSLEKLEAFKRTADTFDRAATGFAAAQVDENLLELLLFVLAGEQYALGIERIVEIIAPRPATRIPNADESVVGIISLRGTIVSILDIRRKLGHSAPALTTEESRIIVVESNGETAGFLVDRVLRVVRVAPGEVESHPVVAASEQSEYIRGVFQHARKLSILLDLERLLRF